MTPAPAPFDRDVALAELLRAIPRNKLERALTGTLGAGWQLVDTDGTRLLGGDGSAAFALPLRIDIEPIGQLLVSDAAREQADAAVAWLEMLLASASRYQMAADLHLEAVNADYEALQRKHEALSQSEVRYRELSGQLDQRVKEQVEVIERTQRRLYQSEKLAAVGSLAAGMAHEINNPIGFIRSNLMTASGYVEKMRQVLGAAHRGQADEVDALRRKFDLDFILEDFPGLLAESVGGADRITRIVANLKAFASIDVAEAVPVDLNDTVRAVVGIVKDQLPDTVTLEIDTQPLPRFLCDQSRMNQVLFSLVQNARQALDGAGTIRIATRVVGNEIHVSVSDNGRGIEPEVLTRIFDPFFTTHDVGKGMGLGLTVSRDVVSAYQGRIDVASRPGGGSVFTVCLPLAGGMECPNPVEDSL